MKSIRSILAVPAALALAMQLSAAPETGTFQTSAPQQGIRIDIPTEKKPYSHLNVRGDSRDFQFAVMSDRYGAVRPGVFESAIQKLNILQPDFVMSVGDHIGGPTTDTQYLAQMWDELEDLVGRLEMPYFYVTGNHCVGNETMAREWERRRGCRYYHFLYQDVLFLVISTDDPFPVQMSAEQEAYFEKVLKDSPNPRWTMVFLHNPTWTLEPTSRQKASGYPYKNRFSKFDEMLKGRNYTVFAGHTHDYTYERRNGDHEHIVFATTGGGSELRNVRAYGEFDEVGWVTMTDNGPKVANLVLDGILPVDVRTVETASLVNRVSRRAPTGSLIRATGDVFSSGSTSVRLSNPSNLDANMRIELIAPPPLRVEPAVIDRALAAGADESVNVAVTAPEGTRTDDIISPVAAKYVLSLDAEASSSPLELPGEFTIGVDRTRTVERLQTKVTVDGNLDEWGKLPHAVSVAEPPTTKLRGAADASYHFGLSWDDDNLYLAIQTRDDKLVLDGSKLPHLQDGVEFRIDARPDPDRSRGRGLWNYSDHGMVSVSPPAQPGGEMPVSIRPAKLAAVAKVKAVTNKEGISAEIAIPAAWLDGQQKTKWSAVRVNACMRDWDSTDSRRTKNLWWRPDWRLNRNVEGSGTFEKR